MMAAQKIASSILLLLLLGVGSVLAYRRISGGPVLVLSESVIELEASQEDVLLKNIRIQNLGHAFGRIESISVSCGCLKVDLPEETVPPNGEVDLVLKLNVDRQTRKSGRVVDLELVTNENPSSKAHHMVRIIVRPEPTDTSLPDRIDLGLVEVSKLPLVHSMETCENGQMGLEVLNTPPFLSLTLDSEHASDNTKLRLTVGTSEHCGEVYDFLNVRNSSGLNKMILLVGTLSGPYVCSPGTVTLGPISRGYPKAEALVTISRDHIDAALPEIEVLSFEISEALSELIVIEASETVANRFLVRASLPMDKNFRANDHLVTGAASFRLRDESKVSYIRLPIVVILSEKHLIGVVP